jgi:hypothetical protein
MEEQIKKIADQLITLGEDKDELNYWVEISPYLGEEKKALLFANLHQELEALTAS